MAEERASKGRLSEAVPVYLGPNKYGAFQLCIKASLCAQVAKDKLTVPLPRDEAPNKQILLQALKLRNTMFTQDVLVQQHGAVVCSIISSCRDSVVSYWMKAMTQTLPVATHLHRIIQTKHSPCCTHCSQDGSPKESLCQDPSCLGLSPS